MKYGLWIESPRAKGEYVFCALYDTEDDADEAAAKHSAVKKLGMQYKVIPETGNSGAGIPWEISPVTPREVVRSLRITLPNRRKGK